MATAAAPSIKPNLYQLSGDGIKITYTLEPIGGPPQFNYDDGKLSLQFKGKDIRTVDSDVGTLVSVTIQLTTDSGSTSFTVLIPAVGLSTSSTSEPITTSGITTVHRHPVVGPTPQGQNDLYAVHQMQGTAQFVRS
jgi:hypothetical protein